jgi:hypothetical protein
MFLESALALQTSIEQKILRETNKSICEPHRRFIQAEQEEDKRIRELFEKLLESMERDSWKK